MGKKIKRLLIILIVGVVFLASCKTVKDAPTQKIIIMEEIITEDITRLENSEEYFGLELEKNEGLKNKRVLSLNNVSENSVWIVFTDDPVTTSKYFLNKSNRCRFYRKVLYKNGKVISDLPYSKYKTEKGKTFWHEIKAGQGIYISVLEYPSLRYDRIVIEFICRTELNGKAEEASIDIFNPFSEEKLLAIHTIKPGDTLQAISEKYYGVTHNWPKILEANPDVNEYKLYVGTKLVIPKLEKGKKEE